MRPFSTAVTITDPLVKYQTLVKSGLYSPDPAQHRLARHLRSVYLRIKDYSPRVEYRQRLDDVARLTEAKHPDEVAPRGVLALQNHGIWRNPLFRHLLPAGGKADSLALTRVLQGHHSAIEIDSPKGLFLSGEVGTGKSMLLDLLADALPTKGKRRWHFSTFMLYALSQLESRRRCQATGGAHADAESEHSLLWMAKKLVDESPILFLDEFQLPDRAASKILSHLFIAFFQLGGVLVASSNRMPEELERASGVDYTPGPTRGMMRNMFSGWTRTKGELYGSTSDFANFLDVLKARCDFWQMEGAQDWRRKEEATAGADLVQKTSSPHPEGVEQNSTAPDSDEGRKSPHGYFIFGKDDESWLQRVRGLLPWTARDAAVPWEPSTRVVYGRRILTAQHYNGVVLWDFEKLVESFGPADYITMASSYHSFIIDRVPVMTVSQKNEARRFITFLDAIYEARCKLMIRAESPPDQIFFPERAPTSSFGDIVQSTDDATYAETVADVYQDQMSPFRPNVSYYDANLATSTYNPDQDSDFGPQKRDIDFGKTSAFTGEDERFAYKRAVSRMWELCSARWHARTGDWWQPLPAEARHWEGGSASRRFETREGSSQAGGGEGVGDSVEEEESAGLAEWRVRHLRKQQHEGSQSEGTCDGGSRNRV
ncbi:hypothetical protein RJ55_03269 [Drechmeria coniospora]|nr:hypothetical protein RJ55_03269 [Drechmeria coniospora]